MKEFHVLAAALLLLLISLIVSGTGNVVSVSEDSTFDIYEESERLVALTFDDGPKAGMTEKLLDVLKEKGVKATFFMIGSQAEECPELVKRVAAEGHQIGIHTYSHVDLSCLTQEEQKEEIEKSIAAIESAIGTTELKLRPPFGKISGSLGSVAGYAADSLVAGYGGLEGDRCGADYPGNSAGCPGRGYYFNA